MDTTLVYRDVSPDRSQLQTSWKACQGVAALVQDMTQHEKGPLFHTCCSPHELRRQISNEKDSDKEYMDVMLMEALAKCFKLPVAGRCAARYFP